MNITPVAHPKGRSRAANASLATPVTDNLTPNNDRDEKRDMRRHSAAKVLRKSVGAGMGMGAAPPGKGLAGDELRSMYDRVIKMTAENKINKNNVWDLDIIYHMPSIVRDYTIVGQQFNFQRASCGLDAGVKIYSKRVDSVYETCKEALFGFKGVRGPSGGNESDDETPDGSQQHDQGDGAAAEGSPSQGQEQGKKSKRKAGTDQDPSSTLADAESLKAKEFEVTFDSDPLFGKTSKLFDEGSAAGLLLLNLGVYGNCEIMFDSQQVPSAQFPVRGTGDETAGELQLDLGCIPGLQQHLAASSQACYGITPSIGKLQSQLGPQGTWAEGLLPCAEDILRAALEEEARFGPLPKAPRAAAAAVAPGGASVAANAEPGCCAGPEVGMVDCMDEDMVDTGQGYGDGAEVDEACPLAADASVPPPAAASPQAGMDTVARQEQRAGKEQGADLDVCVDEDGFVVVAGADDDADGGGDGWAGGAMSDGEGDDEEGAEDGSNTQGQSDLTQWLVNQQRSLASEQPAAGAARGRAWAGASFWRFSGATARAGAAGQAAQVQGKVVRKSKSKDAGSMLQLDTDDEDPSVEQRMAEKGEPQETQLCKRSRVKTLLPEDLHLEPRRLFRVLRTAGADHDVLSVWRCHAAAAAESASTRRAGRAAARCEGADGSGGPGTAYGGGDDGYGDDGGGGGHDFGFSDGGGGDDGFDGLGEAAGAQEEERARAEAGQVLLRAAADAAAAAGMLGAGGLVPLLEWQQLEGLPPLLPAPKKVQRLEVSYDRVAKVVDVRLLKEVIHSSIQQQLDVQQQQQQQDRGCGDSPPAPAQLPFQDIISGLGARGQQSSQGQADGHQGGDGAAAGAGAAAPFKDLSVHLCFICLLHLANEHGLQLSNEGRLDRLIVQGAAV